MPSHMHREPRRPVWRGPFGGTLVAAGLAGAALLAAGCGGSSTPAVASLSAKNAATSTGAEGGASTSEGGRPSQQQLVAFTQCMRSHGVANFPEPVEGRIELGAGPGSKGGLDPGSAQFQAAQRQCSKLLPNGGRPSPQMQKQMEERALKFSSCMRSHGVPNFPEPEFHGGAVRMSLKAGSGLDPRSPQFQAAQKACRQYFGPPGAKGGGPVAPAPGGGSGQEAAGAAGP
jgi:hypothetical protein